VRFTWLTYHFAIKRSFKAEFEAFSGGLGTTREWRRLMRNTLLLKRRAHRELGWY
jgi:hypothetical protein